MTTEATGNAAPPPNARAVALRRTRRLVPTLPGIDRDVVAFQPDVAAIEEAPLPRGAGGMLYVVLGFLAFALLWAGLAHIDRIVVADGRLVTTRPTMVIQPIELGMIRSIDVSVGQTVRKGDVVATLDPTFAAADEAAHRARLATLEAEHGRLDAEQRGIPYVPEAGNSDAVVQARLFADRAAVFASKTQMLAEAVRRLDAAIATNRNSRDGLAERVRIFRQVESMRTELLANNAGSKLQVMTAQASRLELEESLRKLEDEGRELEHQKSAAELERDGFARDWALQISEKRLAVERERDAMREEVAKAARRGSLVELRAPEDGIVLDVADRSVGSVAREAEPLVTLVPLGVPLEAEVSIPADSIASVRPGDVVRLKLEAFPFQRHGTVEGKVRAIAENVERAEPATGAAPPPAYRARIALGPVALREVPADMRLVPGMSVVSEIKVGTRSVLSYFLYPVLRVFDESLRTG